jgi:predicted GNAT family N-acyltransferase
MPDRTAPVVEVRDADWSRDADTLRDIRHRVFVLEQAVPADIESDGLDPDCAHVLALVNRDPVGTGRLLPTGKIGRLAVLPASRRHGIGARMLDRLVALAHERALPAVYLHAQVHALPFYAARGFVPEGPEFDEAGIRHRKMRLALADVPAAADERPAAAPPRAAQPAHEPR